MIPVLANVLQPLIDVCEAILKFWHDQVGLSWGLSIIGLTVVVRLAILPLTYKGLRGMHELQRHAPEMQKMKEKYGDDRQKLNEEMMRFYQEHNFNPLSSCMPLLLQIPFFIALFYLLRGEEFREDIRGEERFGFIPDLAAPLLDHMPAALILLVLYAGTQIAASAVTAVTAERIQRLIMLVGLPILLVVFAVAYNFETGLMVYWITTNVWTIGQQLVVRRFMPSPAELKRREGAADGADGDGKRKGAAPPPAPAPASGRGSLFGGIAAAVRGDTNGGAKDGAGSDRAAADGGRKEGTGARAGARDSGKTSGKSAPARSGGGNGRAAGGGPRKPPPASPRRRKKRSGRRR